MLNLRKLKQELSPALLKEGKSLYEKEAVFAVKILQMTPTRLCLSYKVIGSFQHPYETELEIDCSESTILDSDCSCPCEYDCPHLAAMLFYLEHHLDALLLEYSSETDIANSKQIAEEEKKQLQETIDTAAHKESLRRDKKQQKELLEEYLTAAKTLAHSPYFCAEVTPQEDTAELMLILLPSQKKLSSPILVETQIALKLPFRSKPLHVPNVRDFLDALQFQEPFTIGSKHYYFTPTSFDAESRAIVSCLIDSARFLDGVTEHALRTLYLPLDVISCLLDQSSRKLCSIGGPSLEAESIHPTLPRLYIQAVESPLKFAQAPVRIQIDLEYISSPGQKILLNPSLCLDGNVRVQLEDVLFLEAGHPALLYEDVYYRFAHNITRNHLRSLEPLRSLIIPEPLFGTFVENALPELGHFAEVTQRSVLERFTTVPFIEPVHGICDVHYLNGELEASLSFVYHNHTVQAVSNNLSIEEIQSFITPHGVLSRNLVEEQKIANALFHDFLFDEKLMVYRAKNDKKILEFMTEVIPHNQACVTFHCPENLLNRFIYDQSEFGLHLREGDTIDSYLIDLKIDGALHGCKLETLWDCLFSKRSYLEISNAPTTTTKRKPSLNTPQQPTKVLVLDLEKIAPVIQLFDELGITELENHTEKKPLWSLAHIDPVHFESLPIHFSMTPRLKEIQEQMLGLKHIERSEIPTQIQASLPVYQIDGVAWLERLRHMHLNGILADDMGLGKTLQAIIAITQYQILHPGSLCLVVCPTSLVHNWQEECNKFNPLLRVLPLDGTPAQRKKLLTGIHNYDVVVTSYNLLQKDIEIYQTIPFGYAILDEAQHIKNRTTRNAKSVKMLQARFRLILTGTPIENSLDELWSLFDFLMPGLLSTYDRFLEKYVRMHQVDKTGNHLDTLRRKVSPFILRRMKKDLLTDLPPVSEIVYHCSLSEVQKELYRSYAQSAREELSRLVKNEGFERVQIHVLATLTRLKQICCHPAIFAKEKPEPGDSAKYDMLLELLHSLMASSHRTVVFSQYTRMLNIIRQDLIQQGIRFSYLDGSSKNRMSIVREFNETPSIPIFLVSLKAGGSGLNLTSADTVVHFDLWWNPAVKDQATDRVHRFGQTSEVSSYTLISLNTIEEKILALLNRKKDLVKKIVNCDDEVLGKLTWEEVLELLEV